MADYTDIKKWVVGGIIVGIFILAFFIIRPIIIPIIFGLLLAYILNPLYKKIKRKVKGKNIAAFILIAAIIVLIALPVIYLAPLLANQAFDTYVIVQNANMQEVVGKFIKGDIATAVAVNVDNIVGQIFSSFLNQFKGMLINLPSMLLLFAVFLFTFYFAIRDSEQLKEYISTLSPFSGSTEEKFLKEFRGITNAIVFGQVLIGIAQGLAVGVGLFFLGVSNTLILTFVASLVSMIPVLGSWIVWMPVGIYLLLAGHTFDGVFLLLYGALFVSTIDNLIRPYILSRQSNLPIALSVIGTIGGLYFFGIAGLILGPLVLAYVLIIIDFYQKGKLKDLFNK